MSKFFLLMFNANMNISFGAKLITKPEQFFSCKDTPEVKEHIDLHFKMLNYLLQQPEIDKFSHNDNVEIKRLPSAKKFNFQACYKSPEIKDTPDFENIGFYGLSSPYAFDCVDVFKQLSYAIMYKKGFFDKDNFALSDYYSDWFERVFELPFDKFLQKAGIDTAKLPKYYYV